MGNYVIGKDDYEKIESEDYYTIKQAAYTFLAEHRPGEMVTYAVNVLGFVGNEPEYKLFAATVLYPIDQEFCDLYNQYGKQFSKFYEDFPRLKSNLSKTTLMGQIYQKLPICDLNIFEIKAYEVDHFQLDLALEQGILNIPNNSAKENEENSRKTA